MSMINTDTYTLIVAWGKYELPHDDGTPGTELGYGWKATATRIYNSLPIPNVPTGWTNTTQTVGVPMTIECAARTWSAISSKIALLATFWDE